MNPYASSYQSMPYGPDSRTPYPTQNNPGYQPMPGYQPVPLSSQQLYMQQQAAQQAQQQAAVQGLRCVPVTSFDEAKASMVAPDGSMHVFVDHGSKAIYTKQLNLDGTASLNVYVLAQPKPNPQPVPEPVQASPAAPRVEYMARAEVEALLNPLKLELNNLKAQLGIKEESTNAE